MSNLCWAVSTLDASQFELKPDPKHEDIENEGHYYLLNKKQSVENNFEKIVSKDEWGRHIQPFEFKGDRLKKYLTRKLNIKTRNIWKFWKFFSSNKLQSEKRSSTISEK